MKCPNCNSGSYMTERRMNGNSTCNERLYNAPTLDWQKQNFEGREMNKTICIECREDFAPNPLTAIYGHRFCTDQCRVNNRLWSESVKDIKKPHPLLNPDSKHYQMATGVEAVERMEQMYSKEELAVWAKITAMKYRLRIGNKIGAKQDIEKIKTYEDYYKYLTDVEKTGSLFDELEPTDEEAEMLKKMGDTSTNFMEVQEKISEGLRETIEKMNLGGNIMGIRVSGDGAVKAFAHEDMLKRDDCACPDEEAGMNKKTRTFEEAIVMLEVRNAKCGDTVDMKDVSPARFAEMLAEDEQ